MRVLSCVAVGLVLLLPATARAGDCTTLKSYREAAIAGFPAGALPEALGDNDCNYREGDGITCSLGTVDSQSQAAGVIAAMSETITGCFPGAVAETIDSDVSILADGAEFYLSFIDGDVTLDVYTAGEDGMGDDEEEEGGEGDAGN